MVTLVEGQLTKTVLKEGSGEPPRQGQRVSVHYVGTLKNGEEFDSSRARAEELKFELGKGLVIKGWDVGVGSMQVGERSMFSIAPELGYGKAGKSPSIPGDATLVFDIELLSVADVVEDDSSDYDSEPDEADSHVQKTLLHKGSGWKKPNGSATCFVTYTVSVDDKIVSDHSTKETMLQLGLLDTPEGLVRAVTSMKQGERSTFVVAADYAYRTEGNAALGIGADAELTYDITLNNYEDGHESHDMERAERVVLLSTRKDEGNHYFKKGNMRRAMKKWNDALDVFSEDDRQALEEKDGGEATKLAVKLVQVSCYANIAAVQLKTGDYEGAIDNTNGCLILDPNHGKALSRRGEARLHLGQNEEALVDLKRAGVLLPLDQATARLMNLAKARAIKERKAEIKAYGGFLKNPK